MLQGSLIQRAEDADSVALMVEERKGSQDKCLRGIGKKAKCYPMAYIVLVCVLNCKTSPQVEMPYLLPPISEYKSQEKTEAIDGF